MALRTAIAKKILTGGSSVGLRQQLRGLQTFSLPDLPYDYGALEPAINGEMTQLHHQKQHQTYVTNYNKALEQLDEAINKGDAAVKLQSAIKFNSGAAVSCPILGEVGMMKRKKWSEVEEQTLLDKYSDLANSGALSKLKTREKKFKPIAEHVNSVHHHQDSLNFPFKWSWRDVSIKVQNMRHQYLGVKQKIRVSDSDFDWADGQNHWENFLKYKQVFGDVELESKPDSSKFEDDDALGFGFGIDSDGDGDGDEEDDHDEKKRRRFKMVTAQVLDLKECALRREEERRERDCSRDENEREQRRRMIRRDSESDFDLGVREMELEEKYIMWSTREMERRLRLEREISEERRRRIKMEEMWEMDKIEWREKMVGMQIEHEKQMIQMHAESCQNQLQVLGVIARLMCQYFGAPSDGLGTLPPQVLHNLHHPDELGSGVKPDAGSPSAFL